MAKKSDDDLLGKTEMLLNTLVDEASLPPDPDSGTGPDFAERLKVVEAVTKFAIVRNKLMPPAKEKSLFEGLLHDLHGGTTGSDAPAGKGKSGKGKAATANGHGHDVAAFDDDI